MNSCFYHVIFVLFFIGPIFGRPLKNELKIRATYNQCEENAGTVLRKLKNNLTVNISYPYWKKSIHKQLEFDRELIEKAIINTSKDIQDEFKECLEKMSDLIKKSAELKLDNLGDDEQENFRKDFQMVYKLENYIGTICIFLELRLKEIKILSGYKN